MASAIIGSVAAFEEKEDTWSNYIERLEQFFIANGIDNEARKKAILISSVGAKTYKLLCNLTQPQKPSEKNYREIIRLVQEHHCPRPSTIVQRFKFNTCMRKHDESVRNFVAELRKLSEFCEYGDRLDEMLRDRLVCGINNRIIQTKLLAEKNLTFTKALEIAQTVELADKNFLSLTNTRESNGHAYSPNPSDREINFVKKYQNKPKHHNEQSRQNTFEHKCFRCNGKHNPKSCRHKDSKCFSCAKIGHLSSACRNKHSDRTDRQQQKNNRTHFVNADSDSVSRSDCSDDFQLFTLPARSNKPIITTIRVNGKNVIFQIDTGASLTIMNKINFDTYFHDVPLMKTTKILKTYTGENVNIFGEARVTVEHNEMHKEMSLLVVNGSGPTLLGRDWLAELKLDWPRICHVSCDNGSADLKSVLDKFNDVFSDEPGCLKDFKAKIHIDPNVKPRFIKARQPPYALRASIEEELGRLQRNGILRPVEHSEWATPIVPVLKKDKSVRICGDYKTTLNAFAKPDNHPIPLIEDLALNLSGGEKFSKLDFSHAYTQLQLDEDSQPLTTINTHKGLFTYNRLCFGISAAPGLFQRTIEGIFKQTSCVNYLDDLYVTGKDDKEHLANIYEVLSICKEKGLSLKKDKCEFFKDEVSFLGFKLSKDGLQPMQDKVAAVKNFQAPTDKRLVKSFLGLINYYGKFVPNLATILAPLYRLLRKEIQWRWGRDEEAAFNKAKSVLSSKTILAQFDPNKKTVVTCDASPVGVGAILSQIDENGEKPIAFASRSLQDAERKYAQIDREALAIIFAVKKWHKFLSGRNFKIVTDHKPLLGLFGENKSIPEHASARVQRWALILSAHSYTLEYKSGLQNEADVLSRLPLQCTNKVENVPVEIEELFSSLDKTPLDANQIAEETQKDAVLKIVYHKVLEGWPGGITNVMLRPYTTRKDELSIENGCLLWGLRVVIPKSLRNQTLAILHESHVGMARMKAQARAWVWWPHMDNDIENAVRLCYTCQLHTKMPPKAPLFPWEWPEEPWKRLHADFAGPYLGKMFLIIVDAHSKWVEVKPMSSINAKCTILEFRDVFSSMGLCTEIVTDNGPTFTSEEFGTFLSRNGIKHITVSPYHPASNGLAERYVQEFKRYMVKNQSGSIRERICKFLTKNRSLPHSTTGLSPSELMFGRRMRTHLDLMHPTLHENILRKQQSQIKYHDRSTKYRDISVGESVFAQNFSGRGERWIPGVVIEKTGQYSYKVKTTSHGIVRRHIDQLRSCGIDDLDVSQHTEQETEVVEISREHVAPTESANVHGPEPGSSRDNDHIHDSEPIPNHDSEPVSRHEHTLNPENVSENSEQVLRRSSRLRKPIDKLNL